ncbi:MAG: hypothetical protein JWP78_1395 [Mucilaginibacter sp.]|nr:hypothetical protein [Mucilaginibacter sp.]
MKRIITVFIFLALAAGLKAQQTDTVKKGAKKETSADSLLNAMSPEDKPQDVIAAFKASRLILSPTTVTVKKNNLNFLVIHRFGDIGTSTGGARTLFGLDAINDVYIGFEYGLSDNLNIDFGRSTIGGLIELGLKYAVLHQKTDNSSPVAVTLLGQTGVRPYGQFTTFENRLSYLGQVIISRKFTSALSLQVSPVFVRDNTPIPDLPGNEQQFFSLTAAGRYKVTKGMSILVDYEHPFSSFRSGANGFSDPLGFGIEEQTGGHVFTINITNARGISEINSLSGSQASYGRGQFRLGFTISRMFDFNHKGSGYK